ncbi:MAG: hypothetical protein H0Z24_00720 [Thermosipho sp. (in: Bacteria)]|nr:hypothetical protein [Thermosipho sp. (in: thermotogales)]
MSYLELFVILFITIIIFSMSIINVFNLIDRSFLDKEFLKTYAYAGLWKSKGSYLKYSNDNFSIYYSQKDVKIVRAFDGDVFFNENELRIIPFKWLSGGRFGNELIEPISFDLN